MSEGLRMPRLEVSTVESSEITEDLWLPPLMLLLLLLQRKENIETLAVVVVSILASYLDNSSSNPAGLGIFLFCS